MRHIVHTDSDDYIIALELTTESEGVEVPTEVFYSDEQNCYKYINGKFYFDEEKSERLIREAEERAEEERMMPTITDFVEALDILTDIVLGGDE